MSLLDRLKQLRDIGVPPDMPSDEARYIRISNILVYVIFITSFLNIFDDIELKNTAGIIVVGAFGIVPALALYFNKIGAYGFARKYIFYSTYLITFCSIFASMEAIHQHYAFFTGCGLAAIVFPSKEKKTMIFMVALGLILHFMAIFVYKFDLMIFRFTFTPQQLFSIQKMLDYSVIMALLLMIFLARYFSLDAELRLKEEQDKLTGLTEKLKIYLPRPFVESLIKGDRGAESDYRRKRLTIFFSDVQGFTKWTDKLEPEEVRELLNHYLTEMSDIAHKWGGTIDKFIGDSLMIFFGDPEYTNDKDHAVRCVKMAIEMQDKMKELREGWTKKAYDDPLNIRIGVNTGWATVGNFGSKERLNYTALGSAVNLASRIENACAPDKITLSHTTYLLVKDEIECEYKNTIEVKGFNEPVKIYEVAGAKSITSN